MTLGESHPLLPSMRLDELLAELQNRLEAVLSTRDRVHALLEAVVLVGSDLELELMLRRIVETATTLVDASYGALGLVGEENAMVEFIPVGLTEDQIAKIEHWPHGLGLLGLLIKKPEPLRMSRISDHPESYGFPPGHPPMGSFLGVPLRVRDEVLGNLYLTEKRGGLEFDEEDEEVVAALATAAGVAIANARLYEETRRREIWLQASTEVTTCLLSGEDVDGVLAQLATRVREMADADVTVILFPTGEETLRVEYSDGVDGLVGQEVPVLGSFSGEAYLTAQPHTVNDLGGKGLRIGGDPPIGPAAAVPLGVGRSVRGVLALGRREGRMPFTPGMLRMLHGFAGQAAIALELAETRKDAERLGLLEDRDRIAKDLHDVVIQRLFAVAMTLMSTVRLVDHPEATTRLQHGIDELDETIRQIRSTIFAFQAPREGADAGLRGQITTLVAGARARLGFQPGLRMDGALDNEIPDPVADHLLAVLQEALSNVVRHAKASRADVSVKSTPDGLLTLAVEDNGVGIPLNGRRSGLRNLQDRAVRLGGSFTADRVSTGGTKITWSVPYR
ncbi:histidine kinase [Acrocarpospora phusangensis]|uniref:Histidine kinase n=1 Tax=Acrocarpospora phusangensis TaxID=1070424 RepID=A0A919Q4W5_9ACTN|nr:GAF domain-containing protein [Acrocarpospora phusangensis]GIH22196.1 histidine kinase [Acrocarpospora phusangensis]